MREKADIRFDALSAGLPEKNKLVDRVSELQRKTEEVRYNTTTRNRIPTYSTTDLAVAISRTIGRCQGVLIRIASPVAREEVRAV